jgi:hypothetical protein
MGRLMRGLLLLRGSRGLGILFSGSIARAGGIGAAWGVYVWVYALII